MKNKEKTFSIKLPSILILLISILFFSSIAFAIPNSITLQGKLTDISGASQQGTFTFQFRIYDSPDFGYYNITRNITLANSSIVEANITYINYTNILWEQNKSISTDANGVYDVILDGLNLSFAEQYYLGITVGSNDNESVPRVNLSSAPYSFRANTSEALNENNSYFVTNLSVSGNFTVGATLLYADSANSLLRIANISNTAVFFVNASSGMVGIGNRTPKYRLDILSEGAHFNAELRLSNTQDDLTRKSGVIVAQHWNNSEEDIFIAGIDTGSGGNDLYLGGGSASYNAVGRIIFYTNGTNGEPGTALTGVERMRIDYDGNVGIGTNAPTHKLTVKGVANFTGGLIANDTLFVNGSRVGIGTSSPTHALNVIGDINATGALFSGGVNVSGAINVTDLYVTGNTVLGDASTDTVKVNAQIASDLVPNDNSRDLGSPSNLWFLAYIDRLHVNNLTAGSSNISGTSFPDFFINSNYTGDDTQDVSLVFERGSPVTNALLKWDSTNKRFDLNFPLFIQANNNLTVDDGTLFVDGNIDRVGIGTLLPSNKLTIVGTDADANLEYPGLLRLNITDTKNVTTTNFITLDHLLNNPENSTGGIGLGILFRAVNNNSELVNVSFINVSLVNAYNGSEASALSFYTRSAQGNLVPKLVLNGSDVFIAPTAGRVGIGTSNLSGKFHVFTATNQEVIIDGETGSFSDEGTAGAAIRFLRPTETTFDGQLAYYKTTDGSFNLGFNARHDYVFESNDAEIVRFKSSGNVGIGTTSPQNTLDVVGAVTVSRGLNASNLNVTGFSITDDSLVTLSDGTKKKIKDIKAGEEVLTLDEKTSKLVPRKVNALLDHGIKPIYEMATESGKAINTTAEHPYFVKLTNFVDLIGDDLNSPSSLNSIKNPSKSSGFDLDLSNKENDFKKASGLSCGILSQTTEKILSFGNLSESVKWKSLVTKTLFSDLENAANSPLESPFGLKEASNPSDFRNSSNSFFTFSSNRNLSSVSFITDDNIALSLCYNACIMQGCLDVLPCERCYEACHYLLNGHSSFKHLQDLPDHDSCSLESGGAAAYFAVRNDVFIDFDSHEKDNSNSVFKSYENGEFTNAEWIEVRYLKVGDEIAVPDYSTGTIKWKKIASIKQLEPQHVYDLSIEGTRNFIANDIVAHNTYLATSSGNVGINTTTPSDTLSVNGTVRVVTGSGSQAFFINSSGSIGIGTANPRAKLNIFSSTSGALISSEADIHIDDIDFAFLSLGTDNSGDQIGGILFSDPGDSEAGSIRYDHSNNMMRFRTNGASNKMVIDTSGNVGIGTTAPSDRLEVVGNLSVNGSIFFKGQNDTIFMPVYGSDDDLILYLPFNSPNGSVQYDRSPFGNDGRQINGTTCNVTYGKYGVGCDFDGVGDHIDLNATLLQSSGSAGPFTVEAWIKRDTDDTTDIIVSSMGTSSKFAGQFIFRVISTRSELNFLLRQSTSIDLEVSSKSAIDAGKWYHVAGVYNGPGRLDNLTVYVNGVLDNATAQVTVGESYTPSAGLTSTRIGITDNGAASPFDGQIDEVKIYKRALSPEEIRTHYLRGSGYGASGAITADKFRVVNTTGGRKLELNDSAFAVHTAGSERLKIDSSGNVGINDTTPSYALDVTGNLRVQTGSGTEALFTNPAGRVGIGTTNPASLLQVAGTFNATSSSTQMLLDSNGDVFVNLKG